MNTTAVKVVIDTNVMVAAIGRQSPFRWIFDCLIDGRLSLCVSTEILLEYREILEWKTSASIAENVVNFITINPFTQKTDVFYRFNLLSQDPDDNKYADCAVSSGAACIISNDRHLQQLKEIDFPKIQILTLAEFEKEYKAHLTG